MPRQTKPSTDAQAVRHSRAGDTFHYRWAARRCLALIQPDSPLRRIRIEGSEQPQQPGECAIDVAEYYERDGKQTTVYHQLKHSSARAAREFTLSELKPTLRRFAERFSAAVEREASHRVEFSLVTNRQVVVTLKQTVAALGAGKTGVLRGKLAEATGLRGSNLRAFCAVLSIRDCEGNYLAQRETLHVELGRYFAGPVEENEVEGVVALVSARALPDSDGEILPEDVLCKLGVEDSQRLFPAPARFDQLNQPIMRAQQDGLLAEVLSGPPVTIIHATGGVGKSIAARQLVSALPAGSWGIVYDCFGGGSYRNISQSRHRASDALVQMANEMAAAGLCPVLIPRFNEPAKELFRAFLARLRQATSVLDAACTGAKLVLCIDAADNAEMAAAEAGGEACFARALLRETLPEGCRIVALCRTERLGLLDPAPGVALLPLEPFNLSETGEHLRRKFPTASAEEAQEFHRLSGGNPRVQAGALALARGTVAELLDHLGPAGLTSDQQIAAQLNAAIAKLKDSHPRIYGEQVEAICAGLANLPPFIPLNVLAAAAGVEETAIRSFVSDLGQPLRLTDHAVQFRDEPTETWFNNQFRANAAQVRRYTTALEPLTRCSAYAARALPALLHRAGDYERLVDLALSDVSLPEDNPIEARDIRLYRLRFAFRAALKLNRQADACRLALRAGEEVAGDVRQLELLADHVDLVPRLQSPQRVQELACRAMLRPSKWRGSANVHSAALLSGVQDFQGDARSYLRGAQRWLDLTFGKHAEPELQQELPSSEDFFALAWTHGNLAGPEGVAGFFRRWRSSAFVFGAAWTFARRMAEANRFDELVGAVRKGTKQTDLLLAAADELLPFGRTPPRLTVVRGLATIAREDYQLEKMAPYGPGGAAVPAVLSLCEAAAALRVPASHILPVLDKCTAPNADVTIAREHHHYPRRVFLRAAALRSLLVGDDLNPDTLLPKQEQNAPRSRSDTGEEKALKETLHALLPWYGLRARLLARDPAANTVNLEELRDRTKIALYGRFVTADHLRFEMSSVHFEVLAFKELVTPQELDFFSRKVLAEAQEKFGLQDRLSALRLAARLSHLTPLRDVLEESVRRTIEGMTDAGPQERSRWYVGLARAVFADSKADAAAYFDAAAEAASKFGDEITERWSAVAAVGARAAVARMPDAVLAHRFIRCGEMVGRSVGKEKYWDWNEVFRAAAHLHLPTSFAALSRWRDRRVGRFGFQLCALAGEAVKAGLLTAACGWGFTGFLGCNGSSDYASICIEKEPDVTNRRRMLDMAVHDLELNEAEPEEYRKLAGYASGLEEEERRLAVRIAATASVSSSRRAETFLQRERSRDDSAKLLRGVNVLDAGALGWALAATQAYSFEHNFDSFWEKVLCLVPRGRETELLDALLATEGLHYNDAGLFITHIHNGWLGKASIQRRWMSFLTDLGERFAHELADSRRLEYWSERWAVSAEESNAITKGMIRGLAGSVELSDAAAFFGFVTGSTDRLTPQECIRLLDFALSRLEAHIPGDFGDGVWSERVETKEDAYGAVAGLVWSALGSPYSSTRWEAAHCVRRWSELGCTAPLDALIGWMEKDVAEAYATAAYPFYRLHARLYLLIALARVAVDRPELLRAHHQTFACVALDGLPHVLIQKNAADIALRIEQATPGTYKAVQVDRLRQVGRSPFTMITEQLPRGHARSLNQEGAESCAPFNQEFDWYWFDQVSDLFGVPKNEVMTVARSIALQQFEIKGDEVYLRDPRQQQWNAAGYHDNGTSHSHGSYPQNDTYCFYVSYHSFLCAASALLQSKPIISDPRGWGAINPWADWLRQHSLTRRDGRWLADRRDPAPTRRRPWVQVPPKGEWEKSVHSTDFLDVLTDSGNPDNFICVHGTWGDHIEYRTENLWVHSALVNPMTATSLATSLRAAEDSQHFSLPTYECDDAEYSQGLFELTGWIFQGSGSDSRLDRFDPHARNIEYPSLRIGSSFAAGLKLSSDLEGRKWWRDNDPSALVAISEVWSNERLGQRDAPCRHGQRIRVSVDLLKRLCQQSGKSLIFCVEIKRTMHHSIRPGASPSSYVPRVFKIFLFSGDGVFRDEKENHRVR